MNVLHLHLTFFLTCRMRFRYLASAFIQSPKQRQMNINSCRHLKQASTFTKTEYVAPQSACWSYHTRSFIVHHGLMAGLHFLRSNNLKSSHFSYIVTWDTTCYLIQTFQQRRRILIIRIILVVIQQFGKL